MLTISLGTESNEEFPLEKRVSAIPDIKHFLFVYIFKNLIKIIKYSFLKQNEYFFLISKA